MPSRIVLLRTASPNVRRVQGTDLHVMRDPEGRWAAHFVARHSAAATWLLENGLTNITFRSLREARQAIAAAAALSPLPPPAAPAARLTPDGPGRYRTPDGNWTVRRNTTGRGWLCQRHDATGGWVMRTLPVAASFIGRQNARLGLS